VENNSKRKEQHYVIAIITITLQQQMKNTYHLTRVKKKKHYGTDVQVVEFGCIISAGDVLLLLVNCVTFALGCCKHSKNGSFDIRLFM
jgi:hypothetical protein